MTKAELSGFDGRQGRPAYVAVGGVIYDLSSSERWVDGRHEGHHQAGQDLTDSLKSAPHVRAVIERFPVVDRLEEMETQQRRTTRAPLYALLAGVLLLVLLALFLRL